MEVWRSRGEREKVRVRDSREPRMGAAHAPRAYCDPLSGARSTHGGFDGGQVNCFGTLIRSTKRLRNDIEHGDDSDAEAEGNERYGEKKRTELPRVRPQHPEFHGGIRQDTLFTGNNAD